MGMSDRDVLAGRGGGEVAADLAGLVLIDSVACLVLGTWSDTWLSTGCMTTEPYWVTNQEAPSKANQSKSLQCVQMFIKWLYSTTNIQ